MKRPLDCLRVPGAPGSSRERGRSEYVKLGVKRMDKKTKAGFLVKRWIIYLIGVFIVAIATNLSIVAARGIAPGTALAMALTHLAEPVIKIGSLTIFDAKSTWMFVCAIASVIAQLIILGKEFKPVRLLQLLVALIFSLFITKAGPLVEWCATDKMWLQYVELIISLIITALGFTIVVSARLITMPPENLALAIIQRFKKGTVGGWRVFYDVLCAVLAVIISWILIKKPLQYVNIGTVLAAFIPGLLVDVFMRIIGKPLAVFCFGKDYEESLRMFGLIKDNGKTADAAADAAEAIAETADIAAETVEAAADVAEKAESVIDENK